MWMSLARIFTASARISLTSPTTGRISASVTPPSASAASPCISLRASETSRAVVSPVGGGGRAEQLLDRPQQPLLARQHRLDAHLGDVADHVNGVNVGGVAHGEEQAVGLDAHREQQVGAAQVGGHQHQRLRGGRVVLEVPGVDALLHGAGLQQALLGDVAQLDQDLADGLGPPPLDFQRLRELVGGQQPVGDEKFAELLTRRKHFVLVDARVRRICIDYRRQPRIYAGKDCRFLPDFGEE